MNDEKQEQVIETINYLSGHCHRTAEAMGWREQKTTLLEFICLIRSELSGAAEAFRAPRGAATPYGPMSDCIPEFPLAAEEMADVLIRVFHMAGAFDIPLAEALVAKIQYEESTT